jgi:hypothetical protein
MDSCDRQIADARATLADLERRRAYAKGAPTDTEMRELAAAQMRADAVYQGLGLGGAPPPVAGETPMPYRARLAEALQRYAYSDSLKKKNMDLFKLSTQVPDAFANFEDQILSEARRRGDDNTWSADGEIRERKIVDSTGRATTEFAGGSTLSWMDGFMSPRRRVRSYRDNNGNRYKSWASVNLKQ